MITVILVLLAAAFVCCIMSVQQPPKCPLWVSVLLLVIAGLLAHLPVGK